MLKRVGKYRRESSTMAGISVSGKLFKRHFRKSIKGKHVVTGLKQLDRQIPGKKIVVMGSIAYSRIWLPTLTSRLRHYQPMRPN